MDYMAIYHHRERRDTWVAYHYPSFPTMTTEQQKVVIKEANKATSKSGFRSILKDTLEAKC